MFFSSSPESGFGGVAFRISGFGFSEVAALDEVMLSCKAIASRMYLGSSLNILSYIPYKEKQEDVELGPWPYCLECWAKFPQALKPKPMWLQPGLRQVIPVRKLYFLKESPIL